MLHRLHLEHILFLDIETVPVHEDFDGLTDEMKYLWADKTKYQRKDEFSPQEFYDRAGIWAEFGKIVCISVGYFTFKGDIRSFRTTSFFGEEKKLLLDFKNLIETHFNSAHHLLCAHNGKEFDFPYIARRMIVGIPSPKDDIDGSKVRDVYYNDKDIDRIVIYCEKDTVAVAQILLRLRQEELLHGNEIVSV